MEQDCDKTLNKMGKMKQDQSKELVFPLIDGLDFLGKAITDMNQFRRNNLKPRLPEKLKPLTDNVPSESQWLFGDDLSKRISGINNMNSTLTQCFIAVNRRWQKPPAPPEELSSREKRSEAEQQQILQELNNVSKLESNKFVAGNLKIFYLNRKSITNDEIILDIIKHCLEIDLKKDL